MVSQFSGIKYTLATSDIEYDEYMKAIGVGAVVRKVINNQKPVVELVDDGDGTFTFIASSTAKTSSFTFRLGEEFAQVTLSGRKVPKVITQEGDNKLVEVQNGDQPSTIVREFTQDTLKMTFTTGDIVCTRVYKTTS